MGFWLRFAFPIKISSLYERGFFFIKMEKEKEKRELNMNILEDCSVANF
jgi:hypothetical protein